MVNKVALGLLAVLFWLFASIYAFNHFNAWLGWALLIVGIVVIANKTSKYFKNNQ